jgi:hypothetical protein
MDGIDQSLIEAFNRRRDACKTPEELRKFMKSVKRKPRPRPAPVLGPPAGAAPRAVLEEEPTLSPELVPNGTIYFILDRTANAVKIGFTARLATMRLMDIQLWSANKLEIIHTMPGNQSGGDSVARGIVSEKGLHRRFKVHRMHGEWFRWCPEIAEFVDNHRRQTVSKPRH